MGAAVVIYINTFEMLKSRMMSIEYGRSEKISYLCLLHNGMKMQNSGEK
jgi:hypothetical protein